MATLPTGLVAVWAALSAQVSRPATGFMARSSRRRGRLSDWGPWPPRSNTRPRRMAATAGNYGSGPAHGSVPPLRAGSAHRNQVGVSHAHSRGMIMTAQDNAALVCDVY